MKCKRCGSDHVTIQNVAKQVKKGRGCMYWLLGGWVIDILLWIFLTLPRLIWAIIRPKRTKSKIQTIAVCQNCGNSWKV